MRRCLLVWFFVFAFVSAKAQNDTVVFSASGGFYEEVFALQLANTNPQNHIRYTVNGNRPTAQSALYEDSIVLDASNYSKSDIYTIQISPDYLVYVPDSIQHCIVIRAAAFDENDSCVSAVTTNSYFIRALGCDTHGLPAVSLCADSLDLFDYERGIMVPGVFFDSLDFNWTGNYYQSGEEWERLTNIEFYELDNTGINQSAGLRTHGGNGRRYQQKSLKVYAREEYGNKRFKHRFFETIPQNDFKHLVLKPFVSSWNESGVNDHICNQIASRLNLETLASRPVLLYLNGEYWGIYYIHEKPDERYLQDHNGIDIDNVNIMGNWVNVVDHGSPDNYFALYQWLETADLTQPENYAYIESKIDVDNFMDYLIFELYSENSDWPANNMRCWQLGDGPWRWIFFDGDACLRFMTFFAFDNAVYEGTATWPSSSKSTLFFRKMLKNEGFKERFKSRFLDLLNTSFSYTVTGPIFDDIKMRIEPEIPMQSERFGFPSSIEVWNTDMNSINYFLRDRSIYIVAPLEEMLNDVDDHQDNVSMIYPNPFSGEIHLFWQNNNGKVQEIAVYDMMGRKVFATTCADCDGSNEIILHPALPAGVYVMRVGAYSTKIVKM